MNKICTSIEQSKKLMELGLDVNTADMIYQPTMDIDSMSNVGFDKIPLCFPFNRVKECNIQYLPAWSLSALLRIIPKHIKDFNVLRIDIGEKDFAIWYDEIGYGVNTELPNITTECPIDACFEMVCWLLENGYIEKGE